MGVLPSEGGAKHTVSPSNDASKEGGALRRQAVIMPNVAPPAAKIEASRIASVFFFIFFHFSIGMKS